MNSPEVNAENAELTQTSIPSTDDSSTFSSLSNAEETENNNITAPTGSETEPIEAIEKPATEGRAPSEPRKPKDAAGNELDFSKLPFNPFTTLVEEFEQSLEPVTLNDLVEIMKKVADFDINRNNIRKVGKIKKRFDTIYQTQMKATRKEDEEQVENEKEREQLLAIKQLFDSSLGKFNKRKTDFEDNDKKVKSGNLQKKRELLDELREIVMSEDATAIERVSKIREAWRTIGGVPQEDAETTLESYRTFLRQFYDLRTNYNKLVDQDRRINLEEKEKLINDLLALLPEDNTQLGTVYWQEAAEKVKTFHDSWKNIGPVPRDRSDEVWKRFKMATDKFYNMRRTFFEELDKARAVNADKKRAILEKLKEFTSFDSENIEDWRKSSEQVRALQDEWRSIGSAPSNVNTELFQTFNDYLTQFTSKRSEQFKELEHEKHELTTKKEQLLLQAEDLRESDDWVSTAEKLKQIQKEWAETGPDNFKEARKLRKRFRKACDTFFRRQKQHFLDIREAEKANLQKKIEICEKIESFFEDVETNDRTPEVQQLREDFENIGRVPMKDKDKVYGRFQKLYSQYLQRVIKDPAQRERMSLENRFSNLQNQPNGFARFKREERKYIKKIRALEDKVAQYENNINFIAPGKSGEPLRNDITSKIKAAKELKDRLEQRLKIMQDVKTVQ